MDIHLLPRINEIVIFLAREDAAALAKELAKLYPVTSSEPRTRELLAALERFA